MVHVPEERHRRHHRLRDHRPRRNRAAQGSGGERGLSRRGAVVFAGNLLPQLAFPLDFDYVHVTRYGDATQGGALRWISEPRIPVAGRTVLVLDDILDEGITLAAIRRHLLDAGAQRCLTAVFSDKMIGRTKPIKADFTGLELPDRYVFGYGMDVRGAWRNLPAIYALRE
ncbi:MAG: hypoxanthine-guanine phosphoribosyltransferase [Methyloversatilis sp. 12-65-5]|nr:MAG: hypoxanthine-guanine phosphoribosyltransferase [Methyloversatilis sp. 12-65-5]